MRLLKLALILLLVGCAIPKPPEYPRYTEVSTVLRDFKVIDANPRVIDSLEVSIEYVPQDSLDAYFRQLNISIAGQVIIVAYSDSVRSLEEKAKYNRSWRSKAMKKCNATNYFVDTETMRLLEPHLSTSEPVYVSSKPGHASFVDGVIVLPAAGDEESVKNPYRLHDYIGKMDLDLFRITVTNRSSVTQTLNPEHFYLIDDAGNQQQAIGEGFFESLYIKEPQGEQKPARFANIQRTLLTDSPIFPGETRRAFLAFYPIAEKAKDAKIFWNLPGASKAFIWDLSCNSAASTKKYRNVGVIIRPPHSYEGWREIGLKNMLVFSVPFDFVSTSEDGGCAAHYVNSDYLQNRIKIYAIGSGDPEEQWGKTKISAFVGERDLPPELGGEWMEINTRKYVIELDE